MPRDELRRGIEQGIAQEIEHLEARLAPTARVVVDELAHIRRELAVDRSPAIELRNLRIGFACQQRWEDMIGEERVRACAGCDRPVFDLSAMTRAEAERLLATRDLTPCVRFYRRPDGTVMTSDCPSGERRERRRLAVVASSIAAGAAIATPSSARAEPAPVTEDSTATPVEDSPDASDPAAQHTVIDREYVMGIPIPSRFEMGAVAVFPEPRERPRIEWSIWTRLGMGVATQHPSVLARSVTPPAATSSSMVEAALAADVTVGIALDGDLRIGAWAELRTSSGPVAGGELVVEGLPPHPMASRIGGAGSIVLRAGANAHVVTAALGVGYVGMWPREDPWIRWAGHLVGGRIIASVNRSRDDARDWSATIGLEVEPIGALHAVFDIVTR